jgi:hypothetical protein
MAIVKIICRIAFSGMIFISLLFISANLLTICNVLKYGMGSWSGYIPTDYILFVLFPCTVLLIISSVYNIITKSLFWSLFNKEYILLSVAIFSWLIAGLTLEICPSCRF